MPCSMPRKPWIIPEFASHPLSGRHLTSGRDNCGSNAIERDLYRLFSMITTGIPERLVQHMRGEFPIEPRRWTIAPNECTRGSPSADDARSTDPPAYPASFEDAIVHQALDDDVTPSASIRVEAVSQALTPNTAMLQRALTASVVVGTVLVMINQGVALVHGDFSPFAYLARAAELPCALPRGDLGSARQPAYVRRTALTLLETSIVSLSRHLNRPMC